MIAPRSMFCRFFLFLLVVWIGGSGTVIVLAGTNHPILLIVLDGLRPDYVTPELMPNLSALGERGVIGLKHHSVFPTVTRVNASSIATGSYPAVHGLMYNKIYLPEVSAEALNAADAEDLMRIEEKTGGHLLTTTSLGELMAKAGKKLFVAGSSSEGTSLLLNHKVTGLGIWNVRRFIRPAAMEARAKELLGAFPPDAKPNLKRNRWAVNAVIEIALKAKSPDATILWLTDPDHTAHEFGIGSPKTIESLKSVDAELGRLFKAVEEHGMQDRLNIFVSTDHGFSTHTGGFSPGKLLDQHQLADDVKIVGGQIHVKNHDPGKIQAIVRLLQRTDSAGAIFTPAAKPGDLNGNISGTLSFDAIHWNHPRAADIFVDSNWSDEANDAGYRGKTTSGGSAGHGSTSPFDIGIRLLAAGPDIKRSLRSEVPTGNTDLAPTILHLQGIDAPKTMSGRVLKELLRDGPAPEAVPVETKTVRTEFAGKEGRYELELNRSKVGQTDYINFTKVSRR